MNNDARGGRLTYSATCRAPGSAGAMLVLRDPGVDQIDALVARRGTVEVNDSRINQLLAEIDGVADQRGFVIGATNRPDQI